MIRTALAIAMLTLAACEDPVASLPQQELAAGPPPPSLCARIADELAEVRGRGMLVTGDGESTIDQAAWMELGGGGQDGLIQALAFERACAEGGAEQEVVLRNEGGQIIARRTVSTVADLSSLTAD